jgi:hypothetical protein
VSARRLVIAKVAVADRMKVRQMQTPLRAMTSGVMAMGNKASEDRVDKGKAGVAIDKVKDVVLVDSVALNHRPDSALHLRKAEVLVEEALARRVVVRAPVWIWILWLVSTAIAFRCEASCWPMRLYVHATFSTCV